MVTDPAAILIKIGQGAKPGDGGLLPAEKVASHIQAIRGVPKADLLSPPNSSGTVQHRGKCSEDVPEHERRVQVPRAVAIKVAASATSVSRLQQPGPRSLPHRGRLLPRRYSGWNRRGSRSESRSHRPSDPQQIARLLSRCSQSGPAGTHSIICRGGFGDTGDLAADAFQSRLPGAKRGVFAPKSFADRGLRGE